MAVTLRIDYRGSGNLVERISVVQVRDNDGVHHSGYSGSSEKWVWYMFRRKGEQELLLDVMWGVELCN